MTEEKAKELPRYANRRFDIDVTCSPEILTRIAALEPWKTPGIDVVTLTSDAPMRIDGPDGEILGYGARRFSFSTMLYATAAGIECFINGTRVILVGKPSMGARAPFLKEIAKANKEMGIPDLPALSAPEIPRPGESISVDSFTREDKKRFKVTDLARLEGVTPQAMEQRIKRLIRDGWVSEEAVPGLNKHRSFDKQTADIIRKNPKGLNPEK